METRADETRPALFVLAPPRRGRSRLAAGP